MGHDEMRVFSREGFGSAPRPDWYREAVRLSVEGLPWHNALSQALGAEHKGLTPSPIGDMGYEISFWQSADHGTYAEIDSECGPCEEVLIPDATDWLPFMATYLVPVVSAAAQMEAAHQLQRLTNAVISWARHGEGDHIDRYSGQSRIDKDRDAARLARLRARA
jgi:hypothetical protein